MGKEEDEQMNIMELGHVKLVDENNRLLVVIDELEARTIKINKTKEDNVSMPLKMNGMEVQHSEILDENTRLKLEITSLESRNNKVRDTKENATSKSNTTSTKSSITSQKPPTISHHNDHLPYYHFIDTYPIDSTADGKYLILSPIQFFYPKDNYHIKEEETHNFQKAKLNIKCSSEYSVFTL